jgi:integrase
MTAIQRIADDMVSVYTRRLVKGDIYYARFKITNKKVADGQRYVTESLKTTDEKVALDRARQRYAEICYLEEVNKAIKSGTVKSEIESFIAQYEDGVAKGLRGYSNDMLVNFRKSIVRYFVEFIGKKAIHDVSADDLSGYESWRFEYWPKRRAAGEETHGNVKDKPSPRTIEWEVNAFKQFLRWASNQGRYSGNALTFSYAVGKKEARSAFTSEQWTKLTNYMRRKEWLEGAGKHGHDERLTRYRGMLRAYVLFMCNTGLRPGEARQLKWRDITYKKNSDGEENVDVFVHASHSKVDKTRVAVGRDTAAVAIRRLHDSRKANKDHAGPDDYIWCDTGGNVIHEFREGFNTLIKAAGVETDSMGKKLSIYSLRHSYITFRIEHNVDPYELAKVAGTSLEMIQKFYDHVLSPDKRDELTKVRSKARAKSTKKQLQAPDAQPQEE